jgi:hypothetical protein
MDPLGGSSVIGQEVRSAILASGDPLQLLKVRAPCVMIIVLALKVRAIPVADRIHLETPRKVFRKT